MNIVPSFRSFLLDVSQFLEERRYRANHIESLVDRTRREYVKVIRDTACDDRIASIVPFCCSSANMGRGAKDIHQLAFPYKWTSVRVTSQRIG